jgi:hypothetical protein
MATPEGKIQLAICRHLRERGFLFWRFSPQTYNAKLGIHYKHEYIPNGLPDIMVLTNKLIGLEVKTAKGKVSPNQLVMQKRFELLGHQYHVVRSVDDVIKVLP